MIGRHYPSTPQKKGLHHWASRLPVTATVTWQRILTNPDEVNLRQTVEKFTNLLHGLLRAISVDSKGGIDRRTVK
jgi:hypothetical protein